MKILCLSKEALPYIHGTTICVATLLRALMAAGHDVRLITARHVPDVPSMPAPGWESVGCATRCVDVQSHARPGLWSRWGNRIASTLNPYCIPHQEDTEWIETAEHVLIEEIDSYGPDVVLTTDPRADHLAALRAQRNRSFLWIASLDDPWERRTMFEKVPWYSLSHFYHRRVISRIASKAAAFIFPSTRLAIFEKQFSFGPWPSRVETIPHLGTIAANGASRNPGRFRFTHVGDLRPRGRADCLLPEGLQKAMEKEPSLREHLEVCFVGDVPEQFRSRMGSCIGPAFEWVPPCAYPVSLEYIKSSDVNVLIERKSPVSILMTSKLADYALVDAPIFAMGPQAGNMAELADEGQCLHAPPDDVNEIAQKILLLYRKWKADELSTFGHDALRQKCQPESGTRQFEALVDSLQGK